MRFSETEVSELMRAWIAISMAFAIVLGGGIGSNFAQIFLVSGITVGVAFIVHELAHKFVAQKYGCWAEFRSFPMGLVAAVLLSFIGFLFAAPGAVMIRGIVTTEENGKIAAAGPISNLAIFALVYGVATLLISTGLTGGVFGYVIAYAPFVMNINAWLAMFNMLPFGPLDGVKVMRWNPTIWGVLIGVSAFATFVL